LVHKIHHLAAGFRVKIPGRFIGKYYSRIINQSPRYCYPLLLAAGQL